MEMNNEKLLDLAIGWFKDVQEKSKKLTTGNVSHDSRMMQGFALHCAEFLEKYKKKENEE